jgi:hypothetical protein
VDDHVLEHKVDLALALLRGHSVRGDNVPLKTEYLSRHTKPSEREAREALIILLAQIRRELSDERLQSVLVALAIAFCEEQDLETDLNRQFPLRLVLKSRSKGHSDLHRDYCIARLVQELRDRRARYNEATAYIAKVFDLDERHIKRIYARHKREFSKVASDG